MHNNDQNTVSQLIKCDGRLEYVMIQITYNNANAEERTKQLHNAKVEESKIQEWSKLNLTTFRNRARKS